MERPSTKMMAKWFGAVILAVFFVALISLIVGHFWPKDKFGPDFALTVPVVPRVDKAAYDRKLRQLAHITDDLPEVEEIFEPELIMGGAINAVGFGLEGDEAVTGLLAGTGLHGLDEGRLWPVKAAYPNQGAILPFSRIVAYYGNFYSKGMGALGEYPEDVMISMLQREVRAWERADPTTPVIPAIDYIAVTAQLSPGKYGTYSLRMPDSQIEKALAIAEKIDGIVILEVQPGLADLMVEIRALESHLIKPEVHLAIDPEFAMRKSGRRPGTIVGTIDATEINVAIEYLAGLVRKYNLPPKVLIVHRYIWEMVTNATKIRPLPEVQIVMDMDGWGPPAQKYDSYYAYIYPEPVQFTGFKVFYKNDTKIPGTRALTPTEILKLTPQPSFIQYQ